MEVREVLPLALLFAADDHRIKGRTRFQKLAFLAGKQLEERGISLYDFVPYDYGPYSKDLQETIDKLVSEGLVRVRKTQTYGGDDRYDYRLTEKGRRSFERNLPDEEMVFNEPSLKTVYSVAKDIVGSYNDMPISNLLDIVYTEFPEYAENSVLY